MTKEPIYSECAICQFWSPLNKKHTDGNWYCTIHYARKLDEPKDKKLQKNSEKFLTAFREAIESNPI